MSPRIPKNVDELLDHNAAEFQSNPALFDLTSASSLNDSWLEYFKISEARDGEKGAHHNVHLDICLLGPCQDRKIFLHYEQVYAYNFEFAVGAGSSLSKSMLHGDVLTHEFRIDGRDYEHEIVFVAGHRLIVRFRKFKHREEIFADETSDPVG
jgi:hypothetical protein